MSITVEEADALAERAHEGQVDKAGLPYIDHPRRVAAQLSTDDEKIVALLHDVLEDTDLTDHDLFLAGCTETHRTALAYLCHAPHETYDDYVQLIAYNPLARRVKMADIGDNTDPERLDRLGDETRGRLLHKYARAMAVLMAVDEPVTAIARLGPLPEAAISDREIPVTWGIGGPQVGTVTEIDYEHPDGVVASMRISPAYADRIFGDAYRGLSLGFTPAEGTE